jgi:uncharacterized protein (TIGR02145 family)
MLLYIGYSTGFPIGVQEINQEKSSFHLFQSYPNPVKDYSMISTYIPEDGIMNVMVNDIQGRMIISIDRQMEKGFYSFRFSPGNSSLYFLSARWKGMTQSIKIINTEPNTGKQCMLDYNGNSNNGNYFKASLLKNDMIMKESGILDAPSDNETYTFQFATNISCPGTPAVTYEGQVYNTIQVFSQCWLRENLNVGTMRDSALSMQNNGIKEKYCYSNNEDSCTKYGGLYQWNEMMQYTTSQSTQGICPVAWHIPTDEEWKVLEGAVDSQYGIGDPIWDNDASNNGYDVGINLKTTSGWYGGGNGIDLFGFSGLPGGYNFPSAGFIDIGRNENWWTSTEIDDNRAWERVLNYDSPGVHRGHSLAVFGFSVRCLRDN